MPERRDETLAFGPFRLETADCRLRRGGETIALSPRLYDLLLALVTRAGRLVTKDALIAEVWGGVAVEDSSLSVAVSSLRKALGDEGGNPMIETVPRRGYRFVATVTTVDPAAGTAATHARPDRGSAGPGPPTTVLIVDDHAIVRMGVRAFLDRAGGCRIVGEAGDLESGREMLVATQPDILVLDMMVGSDGSLDRLRDWLADAPRTKVVVLSMHEEAVHARRALAAGAHAYVMKGDMLDELGGALATVRSGGVWMSRRMSAAILADVAKGRPVAPDPVIARLTDRQRAVVYAVLCGRARDEVADLLAVPPEAIQADVDAACTHLGLPDLASLRADAAAWLARLAP